MGTVSCGRCTAVERSTVGDDRTISIKFDSKDGNCKRRDAESIGLIVTELVNSLEHAFDETTKDGDIKVSYDVSVLCCRQPRLDAWYFLSARSTVAS
jgi:two-component sensor histidine kinase